jgi:hypothetical protein
VKRTRKNAQPSARQLVPIPPREPPEEFSMKAWQAYATTWGATDNDEQKARKGRLLNARKPALVAAWKNLAGDAIAQVTFDKGGRACTTDWKTSLRWVLGALICPPDLDLEIREAQAQQKKRELFALLKETDPLRPPLLASIKACSNPAPLLPGKLSGPAFDRNWIALYLRDFIVGRFFEGKHYADIAVLVNAALDLPSKTEKDMTSDQVRLLRPLANCP